MKKNLGIYLHIPFCENKCKYCGFFSKVESKEKIQKYIDSLCKDIEEWGIVLHNKYYVDTIFIGGGTPSILTAKQIEQIFLSLNTSFDIKANSEITIESNPNSLSKEKLFTYKKVGINRLSLGVQSFDNNILKTLGRIHSVNEAKDVFNQAREIGFKNINIDLMFALPNQTEEVLNETLKTVKLLNPEHISFYSLQIEEDTEFYNAYKKELLEFPDDNVMNNMYNIGVKALSKYGYEQYEISNFAKNGLKCQHNDKYWNYDEYLGIGAGASSFLSGIRFEEQKSIDAYMYKYLDISFIKDDKNNSNRNTINNNVNNDGIKNYIKKRFNEDELPKSENMGIFIFTGLRRKEGISLEKFTKVFNEDFFEVYKSKIPMIKNEIDKGNMIMNDKNLSLTKKGFLVSNNIMCEFV